MRSLADYIFTHQAKYIYLTVILISLVLGFGTYKWYIGRELFFIDNSIKNITYISDEIIKEMKSAQYLVDLSVSNHESSILDSPYSLRKIFSSIGVNLRYMYGGGYFWDPKIYDYGEYIYENTNKVQIIESMNQIYAQHDTVYFARPWFVDVMQSKSAKIYSPQISWTGESYNLLTYAFPIVREGHILGVGVYDISMRYFDKSLDLLRGNNTHHNKNLSIYYTSMPYVDSHENNIFYNIHNARTPVSNQETVKVLNHILYGSKRKFLNWSYYNWRIYRKVSLLNNSLILFLEYDLMKVFWFTLLWIVVTLICLRYILIWLRKAVVHRLAIVVNPISEISKQVGMLADNNLDFSFIRYQNSKIQEVARLVDGLEKMRNNLLQLIIKERQLEKSTAEMELAARLQEKLIPFDVEKQIEFDGIKLSIAANFFPAHILSGDLYDIVTLPEDVYILIGDATGKNITAAFFSLFVLGRFRMLCHINQNKPSEILTNLNDYLCEIDAENMFISAICVHIDLKNHSITFSNAGHEMPIVVNKNGSLRIMPNDDPDLVLGVIPGNDYRLYQVAEFEQIGNLVLVTDGITEAISPETGALWGIDAVTQVVQNLVVTQLSPKEICMQLLLECCSFEKSSKLSDDRTVIVVGLE